MENSNSYSPHRRLHNRSEADQGETDEEAPARIKAQVEVEYQKFRGYNPDTTAGLDQEVRELGSTSNTI